MKFFLLIILPLLLIVGCSKPINESSLVDRGGVKYQQDSQKPYSGEVFRLYDTGEKVYQGTYENGLLVSYSYLNKDGSIKEPIYFENLDERDGGLYTKDTNEPYFGLVFSLHDNGNKEWEGTLKDGKPHGLFTTWYENGQKEVEVTLKGGEKNGLSTIWYENGQKREEGNYKEDEKDGLWTEWYENGQKEFEETYKDGEIISQKFWNKDGSVE